MHQASRKVREAPSHGFTTPPSINSRLSDVSLSSNLTPTNAMGREAEDNFITELWRQVFMSVFI